MNLTPEGIEELRRELRALPPAPRVRHAATKIEAVEKITLNAEHAATRSQGLVIDLAAPLYVSAPPAAARE
jgi:hypothetical protein